MKSYTICAVKKFDEKPNTIPITILPPSTQPFNWSYVIAFIALYLLLKLNF